MTRSLTVAGVRPRHQDQPRCTQRMDADGRLTHQMDWRRLRRPAPQQMEPELVAPMVGFLAHEACDCQRRDLPGRRRAIRPHLHRGDAGLPPPTTEQPTIEDIAENWAAINDEAGYYVPADLMDWSAHYMAHRSSPHSTSGVGTWLTTRRAVPTSAPSA